MDMYVPEGFRGDDIDPDELDREWEKVRTSPANMIEHPPHYTFGKYEVIDVLEDWFPTDPLLWQVGKYISRAGRKGSRAEDLKKARFYLDRAILQAELEEARLP